jgi:hypothetical protein
MADLWRGTPDATPMSYRMHSEYLHHLHLLNSLMSARQPHFAVTATIPIFAGHSVFVSASED